jgi:fungal STAND N-terminal Goodbye domain
MAANDNAQIPTIYAQAISRYREITKSDLDVAFFGRLRSVDDLTKEVDARNQTFAEFRSKRHIIFQTLSIAMKPIELVGNLAAGGASMAFPPSSLVFGAVSYLIDAAKGQSASYDAIQDLMTTLKVRLFVLSNTLGILIRSHGDFVTCI